MNSKFLISLILIVVLCCVSPLSAAPKHPIVIKKAIPVEQTEAVVLPPGFENHPVIVEDSPQYKDLLAKSDQLQKQVEAEKVWEAKYIAETTKVQQEQAAALVSEKKKSSSFLSYFSWIKWIFGGGVVTLVLVGIGLIIACCFAPELIPIIEEFVVGFIKWIIRFIESIVKTIRNLAALIPKKT